MNQLIYCQLIRPSIYPSIYQSVYHSIID